MSDLTPRETSLVALGAALASNCVPCIEHHVPLARQNGLTDSEITAAIDLADRIRQVPARKVLETARAGVSAAAGTPTKAVPVPPGCADTAPVDGKRCC